MTSGSEAEQRIQDTAIKAIAASKGSVNPLVAATIEAARTAWREATEAAAKKCEAFVRDENVGFDYEYNRACRTCAAAIRKQP